MRVQPCVCDYAVFVGDCKNLWEAMNVVCTACIYTGTLFFHEFLKCERGMPASVSSMTTPLHVYDASKL